MNVLGFGTTFCGKLGCTRRIPWDDEFCSDACENAARHEDDEETLAEMATAEFAWKPGLGPIEEAGW